MSVLVERGSVIEGYRPPENEQPSLLSVIDALLRARRLIAALVVVGALVGVGITLLKPRRYTTTFSFVPQGSQDGARSGLASLAGQFGVAIGGVGAQAQSPQFYADLLETREILAGLAAANVPGGERRQTLPVPSFLGASKGSPAEIQDETIRRLRDDVIDASVATRTTGVITVHVRTRSADASLVLAERLLEGVNRFNLQTRQSQAAAERRFVEGRLSAARTALRAAEDLLQRFLQGNRAITGSPALSFQRERLERDVALQQQIVSGLVQQYEDARIREVRDTPVITTIERPTRAARADSRGLVSAVLAGASAALFAALALVMGREALRPLRRKVGQRGDESSVRAPRGVSPALGHADVSEQLTR